MERFFETRWFHAGAAAALVISVFLVYSNTFQASFHFDDTPQIVENPNIRDLGNLWEILKGQRGLTMATFSLNYAIGGLNVVGYHIVNILIHAITAILSYFFIFNTLRLLDGDGLWSKKISLYSSLLFAVHPIQTQSVTYIVQRMESLASLFYVAGLLFFIKAARAPRTIKRATLYGGLFLSYILGFMSKEIAITLPFVVLLYDFYFIGKGNIGNIVKRLHIYGILAVIFIYLLVSIVIPMGGFNDLSRETSGQGALVAALEEGPAPSAGFGVKSITPKEYLYTQFNVLIYYITLLAVPANQNLDYDFPVSRGLFEVPKVKQGTVLNVPIPLPIVSLAILSSIFVFAIYLFIRSKRTGDKRGLVISFFIFWFFVILFPTSSFVPIIDVIFEHRLYLASLGFFVIFSVYFDWFFDRLSRRSPAKQGSS